MCRLFESIKVEDGRVFNIDLHAARMNRARRELLGAADDIDLAGAITIPPECRAGLYKCRVSYAEGIIGVTFEPYRRRKIESLKMVRDDEIDYRFKLEDRGGILALLERKENCDDILIIKKGLATDTSFSNIAFFDGTRWFTPAKPLLAGTKREQLLAGGLLVEDEIRDTDIRKFQKACMINAMLELGDLIITVKNIIF